MVLTTIGASADSYVTVEEADAYWAGRNGTSQGGTAWGDLSGDAPKEASLREATQYVDAWFGRRFVGRILSSTQALEWPRANAEDRSGRYLTGIPNPVKQAVFELALEALDGRLAPPQERGGAVVRERVGPIEVEYADNAPGGTTYEFAERILSAVLKRNARRLERVG